MLRKIRIANTCFTKITLFHSCKAAVYIYAFWKQTNSCMSHLVLCHKSSSSIKSTNLSQICIRLSNHYPWTLEKTSQISHLPTCCCLHVDFWLTEYLGELTSYLYLVLEVETQKRSNVSSIWLSCGWKKNQCLVCLCVYACIYKICTVIKTLNHKTIGLTLTYLPQKPRVLSDLIILVQTFYFSLWSKPKLQVWNLPLNHDSYQKAWPDKKRWCQSSLNQTMFIA